LKKKAWRRWTQEEDEIIIDNYTDLGALETCKLLPDDKDIYVVRQRASHLGIKYSKRMVRNNKGVVHA